MSITDMQPAEKVWGNFGCIRIDCRTLCSIFFFTCDKGQNSYQHSVTGSQDNEIKKNREIIIFQI